MKPWHDCPKCPHCGDRTGVPRRGWDWNHRAKPGDNLACPACGGGWVGTPEEVAQAERALVAWEKLKADEERRMRRVLRDDVARAKMARAKEGRW